jgi:GNAT superfamily N-acetyltransferase
MFHGNPKGRIKIAEQVGATELLRGTWHKKDRRKVIEKLGVAWASRFAVDAPYRGQGVGQLLAKKVAEVGCSISCSKGHVYRSDGYTTCEQSKVFGRAWREKS